MSASLPFIPDVITVHLGIPSDTTAENVTVPFLQYVQNVACSEIYPTWPENALRANIYCQISFALNRVYTEFYRSRGYAFDITASTAYDQYFVNGRNVFENVGQIAAEIFNSYIRRVGNVEPLFAQYCDGNSVSCPGWLSQWGTVDLAREGLSALEILRYYYGNNIELVTDVPVGSIRSSAPRVPLTLGTVGDKVRTVQIRLNRVSKNFSSIPKILLTDGIFAEDTLAAVRQFQEIFNLDTDGIVGSATWFTLEQVYGGVKRLNELNSEGISLSEVTKQFPDVLRRGDSGVGVANLQYFLNYLSAFYSTIPEVATDGIFGAATENAVISAQRTFGLSEDGVAGEYTWNAIYSAYLGIIAGIPIRYTEGKVIPFPGNPLRIGSESEAVRVLQEYLNYISTAFPEIPEVNPTGYFGTRTQEAVIAFQRLVDLPENGTVGAITWREITTLYSDLYNGDEREEGQFPGYTLSKQE